MKLSPKGTHSLDSGGTATTPVPAPGGVPMGQQQATPRPRQSGASAVVPKPYFHYQSQATADCQR